MVSTIEILLNTKSACNSMACLSTQDKNKALLCMADELISSSDKILNKNKEDIENSKNSISDVMIDRLTLTKDRIQSMADGIRQVAKLDDPVGKVLCDITRNDSLNIKKISVPIGVVAIIYESRPNVTSDAAALAIKSGNACVLRCGKEAFRTSNEIVCALKRGLVNAGISENAINLIQDISRTSANEMMKATGLIDLLIPRGGAGLINACIQNATVPCIQTGTGICHIYVDKDAEIDKALNIIENAKTSRPSVCNAEEVCLVDKHIAKDFLPLLKKRLVDDRISSGKIPVELRLDNEALQIIDGVPAKEKDLDTEFLDYILAVKVVTGVDDAIQHISVHSTHHSDAIITTNSEASDKFSKMVDSAAVYINASTRFTDGGEFGLGCEMGISTQKLHARGPMGLSELTTYKYVVFGDGNIR